MYSVLYPGGNGQYSAQSSVSRWRWTVVCTVYCLQVEMVDIFTVYCLQVEMDSIVYSVLSPGVEGYYSAQSTVYW